MNDFIWIWSMPPSSNSEYLCTICDNLGTRVRILYYDACSEVWFDIRDWRAIDKACVPAWAPVPAPYNTNDNIKR